MAQFSLMRRGRAQDFPLVHDPRLPRQSGRPKRQRLALGLAVVVALGLGLFLQLGPIRTAYAYPDPSSCMNLQPNPFPNQWKDSNGTITTTEPSGWGAQYGQWSWDSGAHTIAACNTLGYYAMNNGNESRDGYGATFQCAELITRYAYTRWGDPVTSPTWGTNAANFWATHPSHLAQKPNGSTYLPRVGDIVVFGSVDTYGNPTTTTFGHVSIISAVNTSSSPYSVTVFEQNWGTTTSSHTLQLDIGSSGGSATYTIDNTLGQPSELHQGPGGTTYRWNIDHVIYGVLTDTNSNPPPPSNPVAPTANGTSSCTAVSGPSLSSNCDAPSVTITCGGAIGSRNDYSGVPINWTYTNGGTACDLVQYSFGFNTGRTVCSFYFYAPNGFATTIIKATLSDGSQRTLDENPVSGWQYWFDATGITSLSFTDGNGTTNQQMGWGSAASRSIERICSF